MYCHEQFECSGSSSRWTELLQSFLPNCFQGASAQASNPLYAKDIDVLVPNITPDTQEAIRTSSSVIETTFKSEMTYETAYSGFSTRKVIMEERNVYCGAYNVLVVLDVCVTSWKAIYRKLDRSWLYCFLLFQAKRAARYTHGRRAVDSNGNERQEDTIDWFGNLSLREAGHFRTCWLHQMCGHLWRSRLCCEWELRYEYQVIFPPPYHPQPYSPTPRHRR